MYQARYTWTHVLDFRRSLRSKSHRPVGTGTLAGELAFKHEADIPNDRVALSTVLCGVHRSSFKLQRLTAKRGEQPSASASFLLAVQSPSSLPFSRNKDIAKCVRV